MPMTKTRDGPNVEDRSSTDAEKNREDSVNKRPSWCMCRSTKELVLMTFIPCCIIIIIVTVTCYLRMQGAVQCTCVSPGCIYTASKILKNMDPEVKPCDNFYRFACGNFESNKNIPESGINEFFMIKDKIKSQISVMLEEPIKSEEPKPFVLVKNFYKACMNTSMIQSRGIQPFLQILDSFGGWPVLKGDNWDEAVFNWKTTVVEFKKKGFNFNHFIWVSTAFETLSQRTIKLSDILFSSRESLIRGMQNPRVKVYYNYMVDIVIFLGAPKERAAAEMKETLLFEISLANITTPKEERMYGTQLHYTITELQKKYPIVNWIQYINALLPPDLTVDNDEVINVEENINLKYLEELLNKTSKRVIANYLMWKITSENIELLTENFRKREAEYKALIDGMKPTRYEIPRLEYCTRLIKDRLGYALYSLYATKYFTANAKHIVIEMVNRIKAEFTKVIENVDWMEEDTRQHALRKLSALKFDIGYPHELQDVNKLEKYYKDVQIDENKFMESLLSLKFFFTNNEFSKLREPLKKTDFTLPGNNGIVIAYYSPVDNSINVSPELLQGIFFSTDRPQYMNYGAIGFVIGHEIIHGFNHQGRQFDMALTLGNWWTPASKIAYFMKANCLVKQYGNYTVREVNLNLSGIPTQEENVADNAGIKTAYLAYTKWVEDHGEEPQLPGLNYTSKQMFWLSTANSWCSKYTPEMMKRYVEEDHHSPAEFRIIGSLSNSEDFAKDFQCPPGSPMNPKLKCKVF